MNKFTKSHGLGNDYVVLDQADLSVELNPESIKLICHRNYGIGSDGILLLVESKEADFGLRVFNPDGTPAEKSGNGLRIFAKFLYEHGYTDRNSLTIDTPGGITTAELELNKGKIESVTVEMGTATFQSGLIPVVGPDREVVAEEMRINGEILSITAVSVGNPHCVIFSDELDEAYVKKLGPVIENHQIFPNRTNVQFANVKSRDKLEILIWERGAGYTLASGSSSCAAAAAAVKNGLTERSVSVLMPGGELQIEVRENWSIKMRGEVEEICSGNISDDLISKLSDLSKQV